MARKVGRTKMRYAGEGVCGASACLEDRERCREPAPEQEGKASHGQVESGPMIPFPMRRAGSIGAWLVGRLDLQERTAEKGAKEPLERDEVQC